MLNPRAPLVNEVPRRFLGVGYPPWRSRQTAMLRCGQAWAGSPEDSRIEEQGETEPCRLRADLAGCQGARYRPVRSSTAEVISTAAVVFKEPKLLIYKELRRLPLGRPGVGRCRPVARLLVFKEKAVRPRE